MSTKEALSEFTERSRDLAIFDSVYSDVMKTRALLQKAVDEKLAELKTVARKEGEEVGNRWFDVKIVNKQRRFYDASVMVARFPAVRDLSGVILQTVDREMADHFVKLGIIPEEVAAESEVVEPMTSAISIKTKQGFSRPSKAVREKTKQKVEG